MPRRARLFTAPLLLAVTGLALAAEPIQIEIRGQAFTPAEIAVPAGEKLELIIRNQDELPAEFESYDLSREIVVPAHGQVKVYIGPLEPGRYRFFNDFHQESQGWVVAGGGK
jgi:plastocyanin